MLQTSLTDPLTEPPITYPTRRLRGIFLQKNNSKMDVDFILLLCTLLEENLPGLRQLSLKQQRRCLVSIWCLKLLFMEFEVQIKSLSILAVFLVSLYNSIQSRNLGNIVYIGYCDMERHVRQTLLLFSVKMVFICRESKSFFNSIFSLICSRFW